MNQSIEELREQILTEFKQVHKLAPADYTENCTNVVMSLITSEKLKLLERIEGLAETTDSYRQGSRLSCSKCGHETLGEFLVRAFQAIPLQALNKLKAEIKGELEG